MRWTDDDIDDDIQEQVNKRFQVFANLPGKERTFTLSPAALERWRPWFDHQMQEANIRGGMLSGIQAKMPSQVGRLALILHCMTPHGLDLDVIDEQTMAGAMALGAYHLEHAQRALAPILHQASSRPNDLTARTLRLLEHSPVWTSKTDLHQRLGGHVRSDALTRALTQLREAGLAETQDQADTGGRPAQLWRAVPSGYREETELTKKAST